MSLLLNSILQNSEIQMCAGYTEKATNTPFELYDKVLYKQPVTLFDKHYIVDKNTWINDEVLNEYPNANSHYLVDNKVYLCIQNNSGVISTVKPTGTSIFNYQTEDGYVWRYLFTVQTDDHINHIRVTSNIVKPSIKNAIAKTEVYDISSVTFATKPVTSVITESGSGCIFDFDYALDKVTNFKVSTGGSHYHPNDVVLVTEEALGNDASVDYSIVEGAIVINSFVPGGNYVEPVIHVVGDGTGAIVTSTVVSGSFATVEATNAGTGYTWAKLIIAPSTNSFVSKIVLEAPNGFGYEPRLDIKNSTLMLSKVFNVETDTNINFVLLTSKTITNEYPEIYTVNNINNKILSNNSDNLLQVIIDEAI